MSGSFTYMRRVNLGNYEHKEASVTIGYSDQETVEQAAYTAVQVVERWLRSSPTGSIRSHEELKDQKIDTFDSVPVDRDFIREQAKKVLEATEPNSEKSQEQIPAAEDNSEQKASRFKRTKEEIEAGLTIEEARRKRLGEVHQDESPLPSVNETLWNGENHKPEEQLQEISNERLYGIVNTAISNNQHHKHLIRTLLDQEFHVPQIALLKPEQRAKFIAKVKAL